MQDLYLSGGMIPDRGYFHLRLLESGGLIGELDEEFVWEASLGQTMTFGTQNWRIERITHNDVFVLPGSPTVRDAPFYRAEELDRDFHFSEQIACSWRRRTGGCDDPDFLAASLQSGAMASNRGAGAESTRSTYLRRAAGMLRLDVPARTAITWASSTWRCRRPPGIRGNQVILHTGWGGAVNRPFALALAAAWEERFGAAARNVPRRRHDLPAARPATSTARSCSRW